MLDDEVAGRVREVLEEERRRVLDVVERALHVLHEPVLRRPARPAGTGVIGVPETDRQTDRCGACH